jgi:hypothetical protein
MTFCCDKFKEAVEEGIFYFYEATNQYELDGYEVIGDYLLNCCPFCSQSLLEGRSSIA